MWHSLSISASSRYLCYFVQVLGNGDSSKNTEGGHGVVVLLGAEAAVAKCTISRNLKSGLLVHGSSPQVETKMREKKGCFAVRPLEIERHRLTSEESAGDRVDFVTRSRNCGEQLWIWCLCWPKGGANTSHKEHGKKRA